MAEKTGLTSAEAAARLQKNGRNELSKKQKSKLAGIILEQFKDYMVLVLIGAAIVSALMHQFTEAFSVLVIVLVNALLGVIQEYRTEKALDRLKAMSAPTARVLRDGGERVVPSAELVAGDVLLLEEGDRIGADAELFAISNLSCDESMLTGESLPVRKSYSSKKIYMGTMVTEGRGRAVVTETGMQTEMGKIASLLGTAASEQTPLQKRLKSLGKVILVCCLVVCAGVTVTGILRGESVLEMLLAGISLADSAIPEGLPAVVTVSLAMGISRMSKQSAVIRRFPAVETLGCVDVICSDKTGTLTENKMTVPGRAGADGSAAHAVRRDVLQRAFGSQGTAYRRRRRPDRRRDRRGGRRYEGDGQVAGGRVRARAGISVFVRPQAHERRCPRRRPPLRPSQRRARRDSAALRPGDEKRRRRADVGG